MCVGRCCTTVIPSRTGSMVTSRRGSAASVRLRACMERVMLSGVAATDEAPADAESTWPFHSVLSSCETERNKRTTENKNETSQCQAALIFTLSTGSARPRRSFPPITSSSLRLTIMMPDGLSSPSRRISSTYDAYAFLLASM